MKRLNHMEINLEAEKIVKCFICRYSLRNADKITLAVRRLLKKEKENAK